MLISHLGAIYAETLVGGQTTLRGVSTSVSTSTGGLKSTAKLAGESNSVSVSTGLLKSTAKLAGTSNSVSTSSANLIVIYPKIETAKLSDYTIFPRRNTHTQSANEYLISQFKGCPNILSLLKLPLKELDKFSQDVRDMQKYLLNVEEATGVNLDLIGLILGLVRITDEEDTYYRERLKTQILVLRADGTLHMTLLTLLFNYNLPTDSRSYYEVQVQSRTHNQPSVFVRDLLNVYNNGGVNFIDRITVGGAQYRILVQDSSIGEGDYFSTEGDDGFGLSSVDDPSSGGALVGNYNRDANAEVALPFGLEGSDGYGLNVGAFISRLVTIATASQYSNVLTGEPLPTTTSTIGVKTFE